MKKKKHILFIIGTRPEAIKLAPLIRHFRSDGYFDISVCLTAQHRKLLDDVIDFFEIEVHYDLDLMVKNQSSLEFISKALIALEKLMTTIQPDLVVIQGDTSTVLTGGLVAFNKQIKVAHIEAGLRSFNLQAPFPEEMNRLLTSRLSNYHFAPTQAAVNNLNADQINQNVYLVGNTVIDALNFTVRKIEEERLDFSDKFKTVDFNKKLILVSCHRRESFGESLEAICEALNKLARKFANIQILMLIHPNPRVLSGIKNAIDTNNVKLIQPLSYPELIWMMKQCFFIMTDSGGIQEEAPTLGKPVLVLREVTERMEGIKAGAAKLVGINTDEIINEASTLIQEESLYQDMIITKSPYGDGKSSIKILNHLKKIFDTESD